MLFPVNTDSSEVVSSFALATEIWLWTIVDLVFLGRIDPDIRSGIWIVRIISKPIFFNLDNNKHLFSLG